MCQKVLTKSNSASTLGSTAELQIDIGANIFHWGGGIVLERDGCDPIEVLHRHLPGGATETHQEPQTG
jgi:hypothetical protein